MRHVSVVVLFAFVRGRRLLSRSQSAGCVTITAPRLRLDSTTLINRSLLLRVSTLITWLRRRDARTRLFFEAEQPSTLPWSTGLGAFVYNLAMTFLPLPWSAGAGG